MIHSRGVCGRAWQSGRIQNPNRQLLPQRAESRLQLIEAQPCHRSSRQSSHRSVYCGSVCLRSGGHSIIAMDIRGASTRRRPTTADPTTLWATVPTGATTGPITVTPPGGTVTTKASWRRPGRAARYS